MLKACRVGRLECECRGAGGIGGRPGEAMCAVLEGSSVGRLCVRGPAATPEMELEEVGGLLLLLLLLLAGGEYGGMDSPVDTVVW